MPVEPAAFRNAYHQCQWIFDLFAHMFDFLHGRFFPPDQGTPYDQLDQEEKEVHRRKLVDQIASQDGLIPEEVRRYLDLPGNNADLESTACYVRLYCVLRAIDNAAAGVNYMAAFVSPSAGRWVNVREQIDRQRSLERNARGQVLLRPHGFEKSGRDWFLATKSNGKWATLPTRGVDLQDYFHNLLRVGETSGCSVELQILPAVEDVALPSAPLRIAVVPLVESLQVIADEGHLLPGPLRVVKESGPASKFGIRIAPSPDPSHACDELGDRAEAALRHLAAWGAHIVLFPEMVIPDPVLMRLKQVLYDLADHKKLRPSLVLAGSFGRSPKGSSPQPPYNEAVVLNGDGLELWRQRKLQPYEMKEHEQKNFGLDPVLNGISSMEHITYQPRVLELRDSKVNRLRMVTLICEDATRAPALTVAREFETNLMLVPVMAGPLNEGCGFTTNLDPVLNDHDALYIVANSAGLARNAWKKNPGLPPLGAIGLPLARADSHRPHVLLTEITAVPGTANLEVLCYQLPEN